MKPYTTKGAGERGNGAARDKGGVGGGATGPYKTRRGGRGATGPREGKGRKRATTRPHTLRNGELSVTGQEEWGLEKELPTRGEGQSIATGLHTSSRARNERRS